MIESRSDLKVVDFHATILGEKLEKNEKKTHKFNVVQQIVYIHMNKEEDFHYISIRVT